MELQAVDHRCTVTKRKNWVVVSNIFYVHPCLGKIPILTNIFEMG